MAEAVKDYQKLEHDIIRLAGGADNIASAQRCATRLRLVLKNTPGQAEEKIKALPQQPDYICTSHGPVLTKEGRMQQVMASYEAWSAEQPAGAELIPVFYTSAYGNTAKLAKKNLDMVVANNLKVAGAGFGVDTNVVTFITPDGTRELPLMSKADVADAILDEILRRRAK